MRVIKNETDLLQFRTIMEKILLIISDEPINRRAIEFACYIANLSHSRLIGAFLENLHAEEVPVSKKLYGSTVVETIVAQDLPTYESTKRNIEYNLTLFKEICGKSGTRFSIREDKGKPTEELVKESRYSDVIILDSAITGIKRLRDIPTDFFKDSLTSSECPVIIAPPDFEEIDEILFLYDGNDSSVFAIKQFTYLFPELSDKKAIVLDVNKRHRSGIRENLKINELLRPHYSRIGFQELQDNVSNGLFEFLLHKRNVFLVTSVFTRFIFSILSKPDKAELFVKTINFPIFIAHR